MNYKIGDRVAAKHALGKVGTICEIGSGSNDGRYRIQWGQKRTWIREDRLVKAAKEKAFSSSPGGA